MGARSIFTSYNKFFMAKALKKNAALIYDCEDAINNLIEAMRKTA